LTAAGYQAEHVDQLGLRHADDSAIWTHAMREGLVLVTKDEDFARRSAQSAQAPVILWLRVGNAANRALRAWFEPRLPGVISLLAEGHRLIEVR
jgi:predicted nuclease of predicted toxin-antitoxin system